MLQLLASLLCVVKRHFAVDHHVGRQRGHVGRQAPQVQMMHRIDVADDDARLPTLRDYVAKSVSGRGLHMIAASAARWGFESTTTGKDVWFELERKPT